MKILGYTIQCKLPNIWICIVLFYGLLQWFKKEQFNRRTIRHKNKRIYKQEAGVFVFFTFHIINHKDVHPCLIINWTDQIKK